MVIPDAILARVVDVTGAGDIVKTNTLQSLWSGCGSIARISLDGAESPSVVLKHITVPKNIVHPKGWNTQTGLQRKLRSYVVEQCWYQRWQRLCSDKHCRTANCLYLGEPSTDGHMYILLEDLDTSGYSLRSRKADYREMCLCLKWLAQFHATFMLKVPEGLWEHGTYWHLSTRQEELEAMTDEALRQAAPMIEKRLSSCRFQSFVHGDAKLANFCFAENGSGVAAVDFQYVGGGCGIKDVVYFISSCLDGEECHRLAPGLLDVYFVELKQALEPTLGEEACRDVEQEWRNLYAWAWADFYRFLKGWSPDHWKVHSYSKNMTAQVLVDALK